MPSRKIFPTSEKLAAAAAEFTAAALKLLLLQKEEVRLLAATGNSQLAFLEQLTFQPGIDWSRVELFHLDEYVGLGPDHPASFARYIRERLIEPTGIRKFHLLDGNADPQAVIAEISNEIRKAPIDLAFAGIGENAHLAFNDPPADFRTKEAYALVELDAQCRKQQVGEGWFASIADVPRLAISITIPQLLQSREIICVVPDERKAQAVKDALEGPVISSVPASALQKHPQTTIFLDRASANLLRSR